MAKVMMLVPRERVARYGAPGQIPEGYFFCKRPNDPITLF